ncbi:HD domain-containing protein [Patescibacteria group bacterium]|nr:HD domain-containing protein [Patescibacteria group bacterium]MBU4580607.1 HD domain-containing protein [Patescibacteria group bacterium]
MSNRISQIKSLVKNECFNLGFIDNWFYGVHLLGVEKFAKVLFKKMSKADKEIVLLGVWLHDLQRVRGIKGDHAKMGAIEAEKVMRQFNYPEKTIKHVKEIILAHSCDTCLMPETLEGKILASADAMAHYVNDFYLTIAVTGAVTGERDLVSFKKWALEKLDKDYNRKIFFDFAKKMIEKRHKALKEVFTMK